MNIKQYHFLRKRSLGQLLVDCVHFSETESFVTQGQPFVYNFFAIFVVSDGHGKISIDDQFTSFSKGSVIFFQPNQVREWAEVTQNLSGYLVLFENEFVETFFQDQLFLQRFQPFQAGRSVILHGDESFLSDHLGHCEKIFQELSHIQNDSHHYIRSLLYNLLVQLNRACYQLEAGKLLPKHDLMLRFSQLLEATNATLRVEEYASQMGISRSQLNRILKKTTGKPAALYIRERLLVYVKKQLLYSSKNISEIADEAGFSDLSNFVRFYKANTGQTPGQFRAACLK